VDRVVPFPMEPFRFEQNHGQFFIRDVEAGGYWFVSNLARTLSPCFVLVLAISFTTTL
jgi:hypothetical protein